MQRATFDFNPITLKLEDITVKIDPEFTRMIGSARRWAFALMLIWGLTVFSVIGGLLYVIKVLFF